MIRRWSPNAGRLKAGRSECAAWDAESGPGSKPTWGLNSREGKTRPLGALIVSLILTQSAGRKIAMQLFNRPDLSEMISLPEILSHVVMAKDRSSGRTVGTKTSGDTHVQRRGTDEHKFADSRNQLKLRFPLLSPRASRPCWRKLLVRLGLKAEDRGILAINSSCLPIWAQASQLACPHTFRTSNSLTFGLSVF